MRSLYSPGPTRACDRMGRGTQRCLARPDRGRGRPADRASDEPRTWARKPRLGSAPASHPKPAIRLEVPIAVPASLPGGPRPFQGGDGATRPHPAPHGGRRGRRGRHRGPHRVLGPGAVQPGAQSRAGQGPARHLLPRPGRLAGPGRPAQRGRRQRDDQGRLSRPGVRGAAPQPPRAEAGQAGLPGRDHRQHDQRRDMPLPGRVAAGRGGRLPAGPPRPGAPGHPGHRRQRPRTLRRPARPRPARQVRGQGHPRPPSTTSARSWPG